MIDRGLPQADVAISLRLVLSLAVVLAIAGALRGQSPPPNFVYIMVDDMGPADAGFMGSRAIATPHLDELARQSLVFTEAYSGSTVCAPSRSVLMTGKHMGRTSVRLNTGGVPLLDKDVTIAEVLKWAGYRTGGFGKWGLGDLETSGVPEKQGFDEFYGYYHQIHAHQHYPEFLVRNGTKEPITRSRRNTVDGYAPALIFAEMKRFIRDAVAAGKPFFCYAPWTPPHGNYDFPRSDPAWKRYEGKDWRGNQRAHAAMVTLIDRYVGETVDLLEELGVLEETVIVFHSDNGASLPTRECPDLSCSGPFRGNKRSPYEGGVRAPTLVHWTGRIAPGKNTTYVISADDALPTLAELAGAVDYLPPDITGLSYAPVLFGNEPPKTRQYHYWEGFRWDWGRNAEVPGGLMQGLRKGNWKIVRSRINEPWELYNLAKDLGETTNLAAAQPETLKELVALAESARVPMRPQQEPQHPEGQSFN
jgi:arylsulfatase A